MLLSLDLCPVLREKGDMTSVGLTEADGNYRLLTTYRRNGDGVATPVWFAVDGETMYVKTGTESGKVKRIRANPRVSFAPCSVRGDARGPAAEGRARIVTDPGEEAKAERALNSRLGLHRSLILRFMHWRGVEELYVAIEAPDAS